MAPRDSETLSRADFPRRLCCHPQVDEKSSSRASSGGMGRSEDRSHLQFSYLHRVRESGAASKIVHLLILFVLYAERKQAGEGHGAADMEASVSASTGPVQVVKFEIQLYKVKDGEYCVDIQACNQSSLKIEEPPHHRPSPAELLKVPPCSSSIDCLAFVPFHVARDYDSFRCIPSS